MYYRKEENNDKEKTILLGTLIPLSVAGICTSVVIPLSSCNHNDGWITLKSSNDVKKYLDEHKQVHEDDHDWHDKPFDYEEMCTWFWNRNNFGSQNMINGFLAQYKEEEAWIAGTNVEYLKVKCGNDYCKYTISEHFGVNALMHRAEQPRRTILKVEWSWDSNNSSSDLNGHLNINSFADNTGEVLYDEDYTAVCTYMSYIFLDFIGEAPGGYVGRILCNIEPGMTSSVGLLISMDDYPSVKLPMSPS